jgi:hypothetical protein
MKPRPPHRRRDAARHLLHPHQFKDSVALNPKGWMWNSALSGGQAALTVLIALPLIYYVSPWPHLVGFASLGALVALFGRFEAKAQRKLRMMQCALIQVGSVAVVSIAAWLGLPLMGQLVLLAVMCGGLLFLGGRVRVGPPGPLIFVFAASASVAANGISLHQLIERLIAVSAVAALAWILGALTDYLRHEPSEDRPMPQELRVPTKALLISAGRCSLAALVVMAISLAFGGAHPAWAAMGAMAVLQAPRLNMVMNRAVQRTLGTIIGAVLAWLLLSLSPDVLAVILVLAVLQTVTEMVIGFNYGLGQIFVTPMALLMTWLGTAQRVGPEIAPERVMETCLGAIGAVLLAVVFSTLDDRKHLAKVRGR